MSHTSYNHIQTLQRAMATAITFTCLLGDILNYTGRPESGDSKPWVSMVEGGGR